MINEIRQPIVDANPGRAVQIEDFPRLGLCTDVPRVVFSTPEEFATGFTTIGTQPYGNADLVQVYVKRTAEDPPRYVAEFAIPR